MSLRLRIGCLERVIETRKNEYALLTDDQLRAHIVRIASELQASGPLDPETVASIKANGLWLGDKSAEVR